MSVWEGPIREVEHCLPRVRWKGVTLQQEWLVSTVTAGSGSYGLIISERIEWRDVLRED